MGTFLECKPGFDFNKIELKDEIRHENDKKENINNSITRDNNNENNIKKDNNIDENEIIQLNK